MKTRRLLSRLACLAGLALAGGVSADDAGVRVYSGMCDASAAVALDADLFAVASDEDSLLRIYSRSRPGGPVSTVDLAGPLAVKRRTTETDLEGAAQVGDYVYWVTSHGRNASGKPAPNRHRFIAVQSVVAAGTVVWRPVGRPFVRLVEALDADSRHAAFGLRAAAELAPKAPGALNIEGLCDDGSGGVWIGFRNPLPAGRALLVGLRNPREVVAGAPPRFADPALLELGGLGIRDLARVGNRILILAGPIGAGGEFRFLEWRGPGTPAQPLPTPPAWINLNPEALVVFAGPARAELLVLSDDGSVRVGGVEAKKLKDPGQQRFRAVPLGL